VERVVKGDSDFMLLFPIVTYNIEATLINGCYGGPCRRWILAKIASVREYHCRLAVDVLAQPWRDLCNGVLLLLCPSLHPCCCLLCSCLSRLPFSL
jgi:hypothetical protein